MVLSGTYRFYYILRETIPKLAWLAHIKRDNEIITIFHGAWVETKDHFFVEGVWEGDFSQGRIDKAISFFGSGGRLDHQAVLFATPTHVREKICTIQDGDEIFVSNSMVYLLEKSGFALDENYEHYQEDLYSFKKGILNYIKHIPLKRDNKINIYYHCNIEIKPDLRITEIPKPETDIEFTDFATYRSFLETSIAAIFKNAADPRRKIRYEPITTISRGFDSVCCSVLAKRNGCREVVTLVNRKNLSDSGAPIAEKLGLNIKEIDRLEYLKSETRFIEAEIFSAGSETTGLYLLSLEKHLESRVLITGYHGDTMWNKTKLNAVNANLENGGSGAAYTEFRLRVGFIHFVVPHLGATQFPAIYKITHSEEMKNWSSGDANYDRPIAVRIIMEENITRDQFGISKMGIGTYAYIRKKSLRRILYKIIKLLTPHGIKKRIELIQLRDSHKNIMKKDSLYDLYRYWTRSKNKSISSCNFIWGVAKTKNNYQEKQD